MSRMGVSGAVENDPCIIGTVSTSGSTTVMTSGLCSRRLPRVALEHVVCGDCQRKVNATRAEFRRARNGGSRARAREKAPYRRRDSSARPGPVPARQARGVVPPEPSDELMWDSARDGSCLRGGQARLLEASIPSYQRRQVR